MLDLERVEGGNRAILVHMDIFDEAAVNYQVILTKTDKVKKLDVDKIISDINAEAYKHIALHPEVIENVPLSKWE